MSDLNFKSTAEIKVPEKLVDQVIGQEDAVEVIKKASQQRRHVVLIGEPGTGKSLLGQALAELLPKEKLVDVIAFPNLNDDNQPLIRVVPAGKGRDLSFRAKLENSGILKTQNIIILVVAIFLSLLPYYFYSQKIFPFDNPIVYAASMITGMIFVLGAILMMNLGRRMMNFQKSSPKVIVDNADSKKALFYDATGAHAGALLGDIMHDPLQSFFVDDKLHKKSDKIELVNISEEVNEKIENTQEKIEYGAYEAVELKDKSLFVLGEKENEVQQIEVKGMNRYFYNGELIKIRTDFGKELIITPEHKVAVQIGEEISYIEARNLKEDDKIICLKEEQVLNEEDIISTFNLLQKKQCDLYKGYSKIKSDNPLFGYKRIAKLLGQKYGKTRWWNSNKHIPTPLRTIKRLKDLELIPLNLNNPRISIIAKVLGATFGDGGIFENLNAIFLCSSELSAVEEFKQDLITIFGKEIENNFDLREGGEYGHSWCIRNTNRDVVRFFKALGAPIGNKTKKELNIPSWIELNRVIEDEFYGSLFGGEIGIPKIHVSKKCLDNFSIGLVAEEKMIAHRIKFFEKIAEYLNRKGIRTTKIITSKHKNEKFIVRLFISTILENVINFSCLTKLNYCEYKQKKLSNTIKEFIILKKEKYHQLLNRGYGAEHAMKTLNLTPASLYEVLNYEELTI